MASFSLLLLFLISFLCLTNQFHAQLPHLVPDSAFLPVTKDASSLQYLVKISYGTPFTPINLVLDLGAPSFWIHCSSSYHEVSSSSLPITSCSIQCSKANSQPLGNKSCNPHQSSCYLSAENRVNQLTSTSELVEDIVAVQSLDGSKNGVIGTVGRFLFSCAPQFLLSGLASGANGMLGFGRTQIGFPSQLSASFGFQRQFLTCLSSSNGVVLLGDVPKDSIFGTEISRSLIYTPLITNPEGSSHEYVIKVKSIKINDKKLALNQVGNWEAKLSTIVPYTAMESTVYGIFMKAYERAATSMNMTRAAPVAPFGLCFSSKGIGRTKMGLSLVLPTIDLVLQSEMVKWRIHGGNSMVHVSDGVMCLGFLDGGLNMKNPIVIGGFQLEDTLLDFDLGKSMLGFTSLVTKQTSCSSFVLETKLTESL